MRVACIDIGTFTCRLLVAAIPSDADTDTDAGAPMRTICSDRKILRLGQGVDHTKQLNPEAMDRVIEAMREWKTIIERHEVERYTAVATSAVRQAGNREAFVDRVKRETGIEVEVIDGEEEARRTFLGIRSGLPADVQNILGLDIGGGSTEFIASRPGQPLTMTSIDLGVVRLTERVFHSDPPHATEIHKAETLIRELTRGARQAIGDVTDLTLVGTAGTTTSLAAMAQRLPAYDPARIQRYVLERSVIQRIERDVLSKTQSERVGLPGLEAGREEVVAAGALILRCVMEELDTTQCLVSEYGLREGVLVHLLNMSDHKTN